MTILIKYSIIIPTFNREDTIMEAVASVSGSLPINCEVIVVNDGKPLPTSSQKLLKDIHVKYFETTGATGAGAARNFGARQANGNWLFFLDDDDMSAPGYWRSVADYIDKTLGDQCGSYGFCKLRSFFNRNDMIQFMKSGKFTFAFDKNAQSTLKSGLAGLGAGFWVSRDLFFRVGGISESLKVNEDTDFCLRLLSAGASCHICNDVGILVFSGFHSNDSSPSTTKKSSSHQRMEYFEKIFQTHEVLLEKDTGTNFWLFKRYTKMAARAGRTDVMKEIFKSKSLSFTMKFTLCVYFFMQSVVATIKRYD